MSPVGWTERGTLPSTVLTSPIISVSGNQRDGGTGVEKLPSRGKRLTEAPSPLPSYM